MPMLMKHFEGSLLSSLTSGFSPEMMPFQVKIWSRSQAITLRSESGYFLSYSRTGGNKILPLSHAWDPFTSQMSDLDDNDKDDIARYETLFGQGDPDLLKERQEELVEEEDGEGYDMDWDEDLDDEVFCANMMELAQEYGDDADNEEWIPADVRRQRERRAREHKERPKHYATGPVIDNKASRTQRRYKNSQKGQTNLLNFSGFIMKSVDVPQRRPSAKRSRAASPVSPSSRESLLLQHDFPIPISDLEPEVTEPANMEDGQSSQSETEAENVPIPELDIAEWELEAEVINLVPKTVSQIRSWEDLRKQIKADLKKFKSLQLSKVNQLLILRNFATLRLKGEGRMAASEEISRQWHEGEGLHFV
ncbi:hypothetical protein C8J56DRAFT_1021954 [Mycena floridula]|nr:hypothetical protein C8J56DRAFT_1021954 [Mycena floridula]